MSVSTGCSEPLTSVSVLNQSIFLSVTCSSHHIFNPGLYRPPFDFRLY